MKFNMNSNEGYEQQETDSAGDAMYLGGQCAVDRGIGRRQRDAIGISR